MSTESDEVDEAEYIQCIRRVAQEHARFLPDIPSDHSLHEEDYEPVSSPLSYRRVLDSPAVHLNSSNSLNGSIATSPGLSYSHSSQTSGAGNFSPYSNHAQARFLFDVQGTSYIDKVVAEIIETERAYVSDLQDIIQVSLIFQITFQLYLTIWIHNDIKFASIIKFRCLQVPVTKFSLYFAVFNMEYTLQLCCKVFTYNVPYAIC